MSLFNWGAGTALNDKPWQFTALYCGNDRVHKNGKEEVLASVMCYECNKYLCQKCNSKIHSSSKSHKEHIIPTDPLRAYIVTSPAPDPHCSHIHRHLKHPSGPSTFPWQFNGCESLYDTFKASAEKFPQQRMLGTRYIVEATKQISPIYKWQTYSEVYKRCNNLASGLVQLGLDWNNHDTVGLYSINRAEWTIGEYACYMQSLVPVPLYDTLGADTAEFIINQASVKAVICDHTKVKALLDIATKCPSLLAIVVMPIQSFEAQLPPGQSIAIGQKSGNATVHAFSDVEAIGMRNSVAHHRPASDDLSTICYTSGTTGNPKGVMLTHKNMVSNLSAIEYHSNPEASGQERLNPKDTAISYLPLAHIMERNSQANFIAHGAGIGYFRGNPLLLIEDVAALQPTLFAGPPRLYNRLYDAITSVIDQTGGLKAKLYYKGMASKLQRFQNTGVVTHAFWDRLVFSKISARLGGKIRLFVTGSAPISDNVKDFLRLAFSCHVIEGYGLTETSSGCTLAGYDDDRQNFHVGIPYSVVETCLKSVPEMNYTVNDVINGVRQPRGEVCVRGLSVFKGYYKDPEKTKEAFVNLNTDTATENHWFMTGDVGMFLPNGTLRIIDRKKNIFKLSQGEYIAAEKVENIYSRCKYLAQNYVYGDSLQSCLVGIVVPDEANVRAYLQRSNPELAKKSFKEICGNNTVKRLIMSEMEQCAVAGKLNSYEKVKDIYLEHTLWTPEQEHAVLTPTQKLMRPAAKKRYQQQIDAMYKTINALGDAKKGDFLGQSKL